MSACAVLPRPGSPDGLEEACLVRHEVLPGRRVLVPPQRFREGHGCRRSAGTLLEGAVEGVHEIPPGKGSARPGVVGRLPQRGSEEGVGAGAGEDGRGNHLSRCQFPGHRGCPDGVRGRLLPRVHARLLQPFAAESQGRRPGGDILAEQVEETGVPRRDLGEDRRDALETPQELLPGGVGEGAVRLHPGPLGSHQQGDHLETRAIPRADPARLRPGLDVPHMAREDRDDRCALVGAHRAFARTAELPTPVGGRHSPPCTRRI